MHPWVELSAWLSLLGTAHALFGNLYEAVVYVPSMRPIYEMKIARKEPMFPRKMGSPVSYYVPAGPIVLALALGTAIVSEWQKAPGHTWFAAAAGLWVVAGVLTGYVVGKINLDLFFTTQTDIRRVGALLQRWTQLNVVRMVFLGTSGVASVLGIRMLLGS